jgi:hypothetical protein
MLGAVLSLGLHRPIALQRHPRRFLGMGGLRAAMAGVRTTLSSRAKKAADLVAAANMLDEGDAAAIREVEAQLPEDFR